MNYRSEKYDAILESELRHTGEGQYSNAQYNKILAAAKRGADSQLSASYGYGNLDFPYSAVLGTNVPGVQLLPIMPLPSAPAAKGGGGRSFAGAMPTGDQIKAQAQTGPNTWEYPASRAGRKNDPYGSDMTTEEKARYAAIGAGVENPSWFASEGGPSIFGWQPFAKDVKNKVSFYLNNTKAGGEEAYEYFTDDEVAKYNALLGRDMEQGTAVSDDYLTAMENVLNARKMEAMQTQAAQDAEEHPVLSSIGSLALAPAKGMGYLYNQGKDLLGQEVDPNDPRFIASRAQQEIRGTVTEGIKEGIGSETAGDAAAFLYNIGMAIGDSHLMGLALGGPAALTIMGTGAASDATLSAFDRGATQEQALAAGFWGGAAEVIFEKISLDHFIKLTNPAVRGAFVKNALKQAGIEASEEAATEIANRISDAVIMGDLSEYNLAVQGYAAQGLSEAESKKRANHDAAVQFGMAALGGALSGGIMGSVGGAIGNMQNALANRAEAAPAANPAMQAAPIEAATTEVAPNPPATWQQAVSPEAITTNRAALREMASVTTLTGEEFQKSQIGLVDQVSTFFDSLGNKAHNAILGDVALKRRGAKSSIAHGIGRVKAAAFAAVPSVIENGTVVDYQENWKGRGYDTVVISAPVDIGGEKSYVGAVLIREAGTQRYYLHEVLQEKSTPAPFKTGTTETGSTPSDAVVPSIINILDESLNVNTPKAADKQDYSGIMHTDGDPILMPGVIPEQVDKLGTKAAAYKRNHEAAFVESMAEVLQIPEAELSAMRPYLSDLGTKAIKTGEMKEADKQTLFKQMYWGGAEQGTPAYNDAYLQFENAIFDLRKQLNLAQRHEASKLAKLNRRAELKRQAAEIPAVVKAYTRQAGLRKAMEKASGMLTEGDKSFAAAMNNGPANLSQVQDKNLRAQIETYAAAKKAYDENRAVIDEYNEQRQARLFKQAMEAISDSDQWRDKKAGLAYMRETQERNIRDIVKNEASAELVNETYFAPVHENEAQKTKLINRLTKEMSATGLNKHEQQAAQMFHEMTDLDQRIQESVSTSKERAGLEAARDNLGAKYEALMKKHGGQIDIGKAKAALPIAYKIYGELFQAMNEAYIRNGYEPIPYRKNYLPHFFSGINDPVTKQICDALGIKYIGDDLPTDLAGLTSTFKPGRVWNGHALEREGHSTEFGLYEGFDSYVRTAGDVIYHTDDIQRLRALENAIRYKYSDDGMKERMDELLADTTITPEERQELIVSLFKGSTQLSNYVQNLNEYTNLLAGKKSIHDRGPENALGRKLYSVMNAVQSRFASNVIAGNISVASSNFIPLTQAWGEVGAKYLGQAMEQTINSYAADDGFVSQSTFLTNRRGTEAAYSTWVDRQGQKLSLPFEAVDHFVADTIVRAKYAQNVAQGMSEAEAMQNADTYAASLMADRSKGALPTVFSIKNPIVKAFTMFQAETNNQLSYLFKDLPSNLKEKGLAAIAAALFRIFLGAFLYNELDERITGNRRALDPVYIVKEAIKGIADGRKASEVALETWENAADNIPFAGSYLGGSGGRIPVASAVPQLWEIGKAALDGDQNLGTVALKELKKPLFYLAPPFGGGQAKKTIEGLWAVHKGGEFTKDKEGRERLKFETDQGIKDYAQAGLFGKMALPQAQAWREADFPILSAQDTAAWREWQASGRDGTDLLRYRSKFRAVEPQRNGAGEITKTGPEQRRDMLFADQSLSVEDKALLDKLLIAQDGRTADYRSEAWYYLSTRSEQAYADAQAAERRGISPEIYQSFLNRTHGLEADKDSNGNPVQDSKKEKVLAVLSGLGLSEAQQRYLAEEKFKYKWD